MSDEWDDDDFGTFESATDVKSPSGSETSSSVSSSATPAWLLAAQSSPQITKPAPSTEVKSDSLGVEPSQPSKPTSALPLSVVSDKKNEFPTQSDRFATWNQTDTLGGGDFDALKTGPDTSASEKPSLPADATFDDIFNIASNIKPASFSEPSPQIEDKKPLLTSDVSTQSEEDRESDKILELRSRLDTALALKEQTEKSLEELREELAKIIKETKEEREKREQENEGENAKMREEYEKRVKQLQEESEKLAGSLTEEYTALAREAASEQKNEYTKGLEDVLAKCLGVLDQQSATLSNKLSDATNSCKSEFNDAVNTSKEELKDFVTSHCDETLRKCTEVRDDFEKYLQEKILSESEKQQVIDQKCKREALDELMSSFKKEMEESLREERRKNTEATRIAVEESRRMILESVQQEEKNNQILREKHTMALKMLLTSSQEHLRHLTEGLSSELAQDT
ncbi:uncharacterized protein LOC143459805 [Clavelina lepadiformis]|uniref:uncharacterized protein LOC143459805 n=1 Tax=Clavelina lepadiformis TaxID=159417 RepID=UPI0040424E68